MSARVTIDGLDELRSALRNLPRDLEEEAGEIVLNAAHEAKAHIRYPRRTGKMASRLVVRTLSGGSFGAAAEVRNTDPLAHIFERGSQARHTRIGANRGSMPPGNVFVPVVIRKRREMFEKLKALLVRHGATVSGEP